MTKAVCKTKEVKSSIKNKFFLIPEKSKPFLTFAFTSIFLNRFGINESLSRQVKPATIEKKMNSYIQD